MTRYVAHGFGSVRRYLKLLGGFLYLPDPLLRWFTWRLARDAKKISDEDLTLLLGEDWRSRLTAAWLIGMDRRTQFRERLGALLIDSGHVHAGRGYTFALACFGEERDAEILSLYLTRWLPERECNYDQGEAMGALLYLDETLGTDHAQQFLGPGGFWEEWAGSAGEPHEAMEYTRLLCEFADASMQGKLGQWLHKKHAHLARY